MNDRQLVSIIIPVFNSEKHLDRCMKSVLSQKYQNIEIILIDDGSTDDSSKICDEYARQDNRIIVIHKANEGVSKARNIGIDVATGEYITFLDSDDYVEDTYVERMLELLIKFNADISICGYSQEHTGKFISHYDVLEILELSTEEMILELIKQVKYTFSPWCKLFRVEIAKKCQFPENITHNEDLVYNYEVMTKCSKCIFDSTSLYFYCQNGDSATGGGFSKQKESIVEAQDFVLQKIKIDFPNIYFQEEIEYVKHILFCARKSAQSGYINRDFICLLKTKLCEHKQVFSSKYLAKGYLIEIRLFLLNYNLYKFYVRLRKIL